MKNINETWHEPKDSFSVLIHLWLRFDPSKSCFQNKTLEELQASLITLLQLNLHQSKNPLPSMTKFYNISQSLVGASRYLVGTTKVDISQ